jgi:hypothetical protein
VFDFVAKQVEEIARNSAWACLDETFWLKRSSSCRRRGALKEANLTKTKLKNEI